MKHVICMFLIIGLTAGVIPTSEAYAQSKVRTKYNKCLHALANKHLGLKSTVTAFAAATEEACAKEKLATWEETKKDELSYGSDQDEAEDLADEDIQEILRLVKEQYAGMQTDNTKFGD